MEHEPGPTDGREKNAQALPVEELLLLHLPALRAFVRLRIDANLRAQEAESDIVQSTCRTVLQHAGRFQFGGEEGFKRWLFTTAVRTLVDKNERWRTLKRDVVRVADETPDVEPIDRVLPTASEFAQARETRERLERAFDGLEDEEREVIALARVAGLPHRDIALAMKRSEAATRVLLHRALLRLAKLLEGSA